MSVDLVTVRHCVRFVRDRVNSRFVVAGPAVLAGIGGALLPCAYAFAEGEVDPTAGVQTAITGMATSVQSGALAIIAAILPILAPVIAAIIIATLGYRLVKRFSK